MDLTEAWRRTWRALGAEPPYGSLDELVARYDEPHRAYHARPHLEACLAELVGSGATIEDHPEVALALFFHDAIYDPRAKDNEERSAELAASVLARAGLAPAAGARVAELVLATRHDAVPADEEARLLVDVDLSILGADAETFAAYEREVRQEYAWVPEPAFRAGRAAVLRSFLSRTTIFSTPGFRDRLEGPARANLARSLAALAEPADAP